MSAAKTTAISLAKIRMICKIADLIVDVPTAGDLVSRCREYLYETDDSVDVVISTEQFRQNSWKGLTGANYVYVESGSWFHLGLLKNNGMMLHASAVAYNGKAYLFSAPSGTGKSTHTRLWRKTFGESAVVFNDDKPALRYVDGKWYAYGTPWCGKDGINSNIKVPLAGICFLKQAKENKIRRLDTSEAIKNVVWQTTHRFDNARGLDLMLRSVDGLVRKIPVFELENRPEPEAALLSYNTMRQAAEENGL